MPFIIIIIASVIVIQKIAYRIQEVRLENETKELRDSTVSPITRSYKPSYNITDDSLFIKRLEQSTKKLLE
jgi:hypothetical protein